MGDPLTITYGHIYDEYRKNNPTDASNVTDYRPCRPPYHPVFIPLTIVLYYENGTRKTNLYTYKGEEK